MQGAAQVARDLWRHEGLRGLYKGFGTVVIGILPARMVRTGLPASPGPLHGCPCMFSMFIALVYYLWHKMCGPAVPQRHIQYATSCARELSHGSMCVQPGYSCPS